MSVTESPGAAQRLDGANVLNAAVNAADTSSSARALSGSWAAHVHSLTRAPALRVCVCVGGSGWAGLARCSGPAGLFAGLARCSGPPDGQHLPSYLPVKISSCFAIAPRVAAPVPTCSAASGSVPLHRRLRRLLRRRASWRPPPRARHRRRRRVAVATLSRIRARSRRARLRPRPRPRPRPSGGTSARERRARVRQGGRQVGPEQHTRQVAGQDAAPKAAPAEEPSS